MTTRGVFRLSSLRSQELLGDGVPIDDVWTLDQLQQKGYTIGGSNQSNEATSNYNQLNYDTDTRTNAANSPLATMGASGTASPSTGYTYGGRNSDGSSYYSSVSKFDFTTQTHTALPGTDYNEGNIGNGKWQGASCGSQTHGYLCGGRGPGEGGGYSRMDRMTYATETLERLPSSNMPSPGQEYNSSASGDGNTAGYWVGGANGAGSHVRKFTYSNNSWSSLPNLPGANPLNRMQKAGQASSDTGTYLSGGSNPYNSRIQKITFATGNSAIVANSAVPTSQGRFRLTGTGNVSTGYFCGGSETSIVEKMNFSTNSTSRIPAMDLAQGVRDLGSCSAAEDNRVAPIPKRWVDNETEFTANHGYFGMGFPSSGHGDFKRLDFDTETVSSNYQFYSPGRHNFAVGSSLTHGYSLAGSYQGPSHSNVYKWSYSTNSGSENPSKLSRQRRWPSSSSTRTNGYVVAGYSHSSPAGASSDISKYSFSTDTSIGTLPGANLSVNNENGMGVGTQEVGYHSQGSGTIIWKLDYSSDTVNTLSAQMPVYRYEMTTSTMGSGTTGYFVGGAQGPGVKSSTDKMDYATDTLSAGANLSNNAQRGQATSNTEVGYVMLGWNAPSGQGGSAVSQEVNKYDFATDTVTAKGGIFNHQPNTYSTALSVRMNNQGGIIPAPPAATPTTQTMDQYSPSLSNSGYWLGGKENPGPSGSRAAKIDFSTETVSGLPNTPLRAQFQGGLSSSTYGYSVAGYDEVPDGAARYKSNIYKVQYSTDTMSGQGTYPAGKILGSTGVSAGTTHGYIAGGHDTGGSSSNGGGRSSIHKFTFATHTFATIPDKLSQDLMPGSPVPTPNRGSGGGNREYGYWVAMNSASNPNRWGQMTKISYSTDTTYGGLPRMASEGSTGMEGTSTTSSKTAMYTLGNWLQPSSTSRHSSLFEKWTIATDTSAVLPSSTPGLTSTGSSDSATGNWEAGYHNGSEQCKKIVYATDTTSQNPGTAFTPSTLPSSPRVDREGIAVSARNGDGGKVTNPVVC